MERVKFVLLAAVRTGAIKVFHPISPTIPLRK